MSGPTVLVFTEVLRLKILSSTALHATSSFCFKKTWPFEERQVKSRTSEWLSERRGVWNEMLQNKTCRPLKGEFQRSRISAGIYSRWHWSNKVAPKALTVLYAWISETLGLAIIEQKWRRKRAQSLKGEKAERKPTVVVVRVRRSVVERLFGFISEL